MTATLVIFARAPEPGRVKTRLAAGLGDASALAIYRALGERVVEGARGARGRELVVAFTPCGAERALRDWLGDDLRYTPQCGGDLGARMAAAIAAELERGADRVVVIGTDCPDAGRDIIAGAFSALDAADVVIGPAADGGYYLLGMRRLYPELFTGIEWSTSRTLAQTLAAAHALGLRIHVLDTLTDIDTADDWKRWRSADGAPRTQPR